MRPVPEPRVRMVTVMTVRELRAELQSRGLSMSGGKKELKNGSRRVTGLGWTHWRH